jgi:hypothetical protein
MNSLPIKSIEDLELMKGDIISLTPNEFKRKHKIDDSHFGLVYVLNRKRLEKIEDILQ